MSHTIAEYLNLVAREHANKPKYIAWLTALIQPVIDSQNFNDSVRDAFDLDTAIGAQLDILGQWIGKSRIVPVPIAGLYFTLDTGPGLDAGMLIGPYDPLTGLEALHDDIYRGVLRARVDYNRWDGSIPMAVQSMSEAFPSSASDPFYAAFVAYDPYYINIMGTMTYYSLWNTLRAFDFSGNAPFVNPLVNQSDIAQIQAHGTTLDGEYITSAGFANCVEKKTINGVPTTMIRYNAGDVITAGTCRTKVKTYAIPNRVFARWDIDVAFGNADGVNDWTLTNSGDSPIVFWSITSPDQLNGPLGLQVDTDS